MTLFVFAFVVIDYSKIFLPKLQVPYTLRHMASIAALDAPPNPSASSVTTDHTELSRKLFERVYSHHKDPKCRLDVISEMENDALKPVGGGRCNVNVQQLIRFSHYPVITSLAELNSLPQVLGRNEFGVMPLFMSAVVDATAQKGMFPMALDFGNGLMLFGPKCHTDRAITTIVKKDVSVAGANDGSSSNDEVTSTPSLKVEITPIFDFSKLGLSRKFLRKCEVRVHFSVKQGEQSMKDLHKALAMIRRQHGENWLCAPLRSCVQHMMMAPHAFPTTFYVLVVTQKGLPNDVIACDLGYIVGDIATAYTGAYEVDGAGSLTLGASAKVLQLLEISIWDLGMMMNYKEKVLSCTTLRRNKWLQTVEDRKAKYASEVDAARNVPGALQGTKWYHMSNPEGDLTNAKCESLLLKDPRKQHALNVLAAGVDADVLMSASSIRDLCVVSPQATVDNSALTSIDDDTAASSSKSQQKKALRMQEIAAKKALKKQNGGILPPRPEPRAVSE